MSERNRTEVKSTRRIRSVGAAPGRVNLIGEHVDYNGGRCLPIALRQTTRATVSHLADGALRFTSGDRVWEGNVDALRDREALPDWARYVAGVLVALEVHDGLDVRIESDVPIGAGLSSSAALECSVAIAVDDLLGLGRSRDELEAACVHAESDYVGAPTGGLDQAIAMHAREGHALLVDFATGTREQVPFDPAAHGLGLLVMDTRVSHELTDGGYGSRRDEAHEAARRLGVERLADVEGAVDLPEPLAGRARHVAGEVARADAFVSALRADDWAALGPLMDASHVSLRDDYEVSSVELDVAVAVAREAGALGARMTGGGFGGSAIALVPRERATAVRTAVTTEFTAQGWAAPAFIEVEPGPGARVLEA